MAYLGTPGGFVFDVSTVSTGSSVMPWDVDGEMVTDGTIGPERDGV